MELRCRYGRVYPKGGEILQAYSDHPRIRAKLRALPCAMSERGDVETVITFHVDDVKQMFSVLKPYGVDRSRTPSGRDSKRWAVATDSKGVNVRRRKRL